MRTNPISPRLAQSEMAEEFFGDFAPLVKIHGGWIANGVITKNQGSEAVSVQIKNVSSQMLQPLC